MISILFFADLSYKITKSTEHPKKWDYAQFEIRKLNIVKRNKKYYILSKHAHNILTSPKHLQNSLGVYSSPTHAPTGFAIHTPFALRGPRRQTVFPSFS